MEASLDNDDMSDENGYDSWADAMIDSTSKSLFEYTLAPEPAVNISNLNWMSKEGTEDAWLEQMMIQGTQNSVVLDEQDHVWTSLLSSVLQPTVQDQSNSKGSYRKLQTPLEFFAIEDWISQYQPRVAPLLKKLRLTIAASCTMTGAVWVADQVPDTQAVLLLDPRLDTRNPNSGYVEMSGFSLSSTVLARLLSRLLPELSNVTELQIAHFDAFEKDELFAVLRADGFSLNESESLVSSMWHLPLENKHLAARLSGIKENLRFLLEHKVIVVRDLDPERDLDLLNEHWQIKSNYSRDYLKKTIETNPSTGVEVNGSLVSWVCQYNYGALGNLFTLPQHRRKGYARIALLYQLDKQFKTRESMHPETCPTQHTHNVNKTIKNNKIGCEPVYAIILDTNEISCRLFQSVGFEKVCAANWYRSYKTFFTGLKRKISG